MLAADLRGAAPALLAVSGLFLVPGRRGLRGRGGVLVAACLLVPWMLPCGSVVDGRVGASD